MSENQKAVSGSAAMSFLGSMWFHWKAATRSTVTQRLAAAKRPMCFPAATVVVCCVHRHIECNRHSNTGCEILYDTAALGVRCV